MASAFPALPGLYSFLFMYMEPVSTFAAATSIWFYPGTAWYFHSMVPSSTAVPAVLDDRSQQAMWHLGNCEQS